MNATKDVLSCPVGSGGSAGPADEDEPGHRVRVVLDVVGQHLEPVVLGRDRRGDRGVVPGGAVGQTGRGGGRRQRRHHDGVGQHRGQPAPALGRGVRVGRDPAYGVQAGARPHQQRERHRQQHLAGDHQRLADRELVEGRRHRALDGVLDRHQRVVGLAAPDRVQRGGDAGLRLQLAAARGRERAQRGLGERAGRAEVGVAGGRHSRHTPTLVAAGSRRRSPELQSLRGSARRSPAAPRARACGRSAPPTSALGVGAGLGPAVDRAEHQPVAVVVEQRRRERQPPAHVAERVVAHDRDVPQRAAGRRRPRSAARDAGRRAGGTRRLSARSRGQRRTAASSRHRPAATAAADGDRLVGVQLPGGHGCPSRDGGQGRVQATRTSLHGMDRAELEALLRDVAAGGVAVEAALDRLADGPMNGALDLGFARVDTHRGAAHRRPRGRLRRRQDAGADGRRSCARSPTSPAAGPALATRVPAETVAAVRAAFPDALVDEAARSRRRRPAAGAARHRLRASPPAPPTGRSRPRRRSSPGRSAPGSSGSTTSASPGCTG